MKIVYQGDIHQTDRTPINRIDDYSAAQSRKLNQLVSFANTHKAHLLLGGDIFDKHSVSAEVVNRVSETLSKCNQPIYAVLGQHDVPYHQVDMRKSPVYSLWAAGLIRNRDQEQIKIDDHTVITFVDWEKPVQDPVPGKFNILLGHISVFKGTVPGYWKGEGYTERTIKDKYPGYALYLCGDIHSPLVSQGVIVSGPMMRNSIDLKGYQPRCYLIDTETGLIQPLHYNVENDVFNDLDETISHEMDLTNLIEAMKASGRVRASFKRDCLALADDIHTKNLIEEIFDGLS